MKAIKITLGMIASFGIALLADELIKNQLETGSNNGVVILIIFICGVALTFSIIFEKNGCKNCGDVFEKLNKEKLCSVCCKPECDGQETK